jgi:glycosyltransferase involved in cell wall biosynthesis
MRKKIVFIAPIRASFILQDIRILSEAYEVEELIYDWKDKKWTIFFMIKLFLAILRRKKQIDLIFISFGGYWSMISVLAGKLIGIPTVIVINGTDAVSIPTLSYGSLRKPLLKKACKISYNYASILVPVSQSLIFFENTYSFPLPIKYGLDHHFPKNKFNKKVVFNGLNVDFWNRNEAVTRFDKNFISVISEGQHILKGLPLIAAIAERYDDCSFYIVGSVDLEKKYTHKNLHFLGRLNQEELRDLYSTSNYYMQLSNFEGFGMSLCEAMLCECIPIVSNVNMLPEIAGSNGYILKNASEEDLSALLNEALVKNNIGKGIAARKSILDNFTIEMRKRKLYHVIDELIAK